MTTNSSDQPPTPDERDRAAARMKWMEGYFAGSMPRVPELDAAADGFDAGYLAARAEGVAKGLVVTGDTSDGYHTFKELYAYRKAYNACLFNEWAARGVYDVHKSRRHHDGEECFGGGWFIVTAQTPAGQVSNHYKNEDWNLFGVPECERGAEWDGHTAEVGLERLFQTARAALTPAHASVLEEDGNAE